MTTLLATAQNCADEIGIVRPSSLVGSSDLTARRILACAQREGEALWRAHSWSALQREYTFSTVASTQSYAVPDDWGRPLQSTAWDRSNYREMRSGISPVEWQYATSGLVATTSGFYQLRFLSGPTAGSIFVDPTPASVVSMAIEYIANTWCESSGGTGQSVWTADTDVCRLDQELFSLGLLWRIKRALGLAYADDRADYDVQLRAAIKADLALRPIDLAPQRALPYPNVPEGSWPSS